MSLPRAAFSRDPLAVAALGMRRMLERKLLLNKAKLVAQALVLCCIRGANLSKKSNPLLSAAVIIAVMMRNRVNWGRFYCDKQQNGFQLRCS